MDAILAFLILFTLILNFLAIIGILFRKAPFIKIVGRRKYLGLLVVSMVLGAIINSQLPNIPKTSKANTEAGDTPKGTQQNVEKPDPSARCLSAPQTIREQGVYWLRKNLVAEWEAGKLKILGIGVVESEKNVGHKFFPQLYFVSIRFSSPSTNPKPYTATWATNQIEDLGLAYIINDATARVSDMGDGRTTDGHFSERDDGATESMRCAKDPL